MTDLDVEQTCLMCLTICWCIEYS